MTFIEFLRTKERERNPVGDFARDAITDANPPTDSYAEWTAHLRNSPANVLAVFQKCWAMYIRHLAVKRERILSR
jgi:hypothetical protein